MIQVPPNNALKPIRYCGWLERQPVCPVLTPSPPLPLNFHAIHKRARQNFPPCRAARRAAGAQKAVVVVVVGALHQGPAHTGRRRLNPPWDKLDDKGERWEKPPEEDCCTQALR
eukprot:364189-Chlamydomonas_euryale.AAC.40